MTTAGTISYPWRRRAQTAASAAQTSGGALWPSVFLAAHVPLGLLIDADPRFAVAHALLAVFVGLTWAGLGDRPDRVAWVAAYVMGAEVLWRMAGAQVAWELGKYAVIGVMGLWMLQKGRAQGPVLSSLYFALLVPSAVLTFLAFDFALARQQISFNLSGPLVLMIAVWFFSQVQLSPRQRQNLCIAAIAPAVGVAAIAFGATVLNPDIAFGSESNMEASGGFGPNQVSAVLGLGALMALVAIAEAGSGWGLRIVMLACLLLLTVQSAFTFSRGGLFNAGAAALVGSLYLLRDSRTRIRAIAGGTLLLVLGYYVVYPLMDGFTGGALSSRFGDTGLTNRDTIVWADLQIWQEHLLFGVGPGRANAFREAYFRNVAAHTEYTRMVAEHGLLGLGALIALIGLVIQVSRQPRSLRERAVMGALFAWGFLFMLSYGMRLAAPAFVIGLACLPTSTQALASVPLAAWRRGVVQSARRPLARLGPSRHWRTT